MTLLSLHPHSLAAPGLLLLRIAQWGLIGLSAGFLGASFWIWQETRQLTEAVQIQQEAVTRAEHLQQQFLEQARKQGFDLSDTRIQQLAQEVSFAQQLSMRRRFSWTRFLSDLEAAVPPHVAMESIVLNFPKTSLVLNGMARELSDLSSFVERLERHPAFNHVVVSSHKLKQPKEKRQAKNPVVTFSMKVTYTPN
ncbi:MAG: hypothetical protein D6704_04575 [Nitrospirae bacterium]|nr:MAG: hypothetical protein D6704_04575 [Nitrospirota bacterium]